jgi:DNA-binding MarR family transcriptional regulator
MAKANVGSILIPQHHIDEHLREFPGVFEPYSTQVLFAVRALAQRVNDRATEWLAPLGLTATQFNYLAVLYAQRSTGLTLNDISALVHTANASVTSMINALERESLVKRTPHPSDGRSSVVNLTARGRKLFERAFRVHHEHIERTLAGISVADRRAILNGLVRVGDAFAAAGRPVKEPSGRTIKNSK